MLIASNWRDYELLDAGGGERLERWRDIILIRPDPQVIWDSPRKNPLWQNAHARYHRSVSGGGRWETYGSTPESWRVEYGNLRFNVKPMGFKHTGLFPEQAVNWERMQTLISDRLSRSGKPVEILNLFAYTGGATVACLAAGAQVTHVDAAKGMVQWAKENAAASGLADRHARWLVDDCLKFCAREGRRGSRYHGIIMDPPSYGRGPGGEVWKLENMLERLVVTAAGLLADNPCFFLVNSYTGGLSPSAVGYMVSSVLVKRYGGSAAADEIGLMVTESGLALPCGGTALWTPRVSVES
jgi:23S rRNA (cytosine1962-C5)-methyltransferase